MLHGLRLIIYDLDGTLIDSTKAIVDTFNRVIGELGEITPSTKVIEEMIGLPITEMFRRVLPQKKHTCVQVCWDRFVEIYADVGPKETRILPSVPETLAYFQKAGYMQSIATTKRSDVASRLLSELGLLRYFDLVLGINDVTNPKPAPDIIELTLNRLKVVPQEALLIDDSTFGLEAGIRAGVHTVGVTTGTHNNERLSTVRPDYIINDLIELTQLVD